MVANHSKSPDIVSLVETILKYWIGLALVIIVDLHLGGHISWGTSPVRSEVLGSEPKICQLELDLAIRVIAYKYVGWLEV